MNQIGSISAKYVIDQIFIIFHYEQVLDQFGQYYKYNGTSQDNISDKQRPYKQKQFRTTAMEQLVRMPTRAHSKLNTINLTSNDSCMTMSFKEDRAIEANQLTFQKVNLNEQPLLKQSFKPTEGKKTERKDKIRTCMISKFSRLQFQTDISMQSLFLAIDLFDKCFQKMEDLKAEVQVNDLALVCFMLAIKYQEVYPPSLLLVQSKLNSRINFSDYVELQLEVLNKLEYNLIVDSPEQYFDYSKCSQEKKLERDRKISEAYLLLELASTNAQIRKKYNWKQIVEAIQVIQLPLKDLRQKQKEISQQLLEIAKILIVERSKVEGANYWLYKKYCDSRYHHIAITQFYEFPQDY